MDPRTHLHHVLFQLTPTRTRCELVIFAGGVSEKLASGLLQPFLTHLKAAKDQISRGGYSITLQPPAASSNASWFTKGTVQRFVRFVSTPEILERFPTIEKELEQIESSVQSNELSIADADGAAGNYHRSSASSKSKGDHQENSETLQEENSKVHLQRALETRKAVLRKEQAMAYARALVSGFELESLNDLIMFADAFGASRLREACINFMELCKRKNQDRLWMDEIAAMQASRLELPYLGSSGIELAGEENYPQNGGLSIGKLNGSMDASDSATSHGSSDLNQDGSLPASAQTQSMDGRGQVPMPWPNNLPQYMQNFQGPLFQQMPPYQAYPYPYFPGNMQWPPNMDDSSLGRDWEPGDRRKHRSSSRNKKKSSRAKEHEEDSMEPSDSGSGSESDENSRNDETNSSVDLVHKKKHGKKSSRKVIIRNINYITSKRDDETSSEEEFIDGEALKQQVEEAVGSLERRHKSTSRHHKKSQRNAIDGSNYATDREKKNATDEVKDQWGTFQSLLMKEKDLDSVETERSSLQLQEEHFTNKGFEEASLAFNLETEQVRKHQTFSNDSFVATKMETTNDGESHIKSFQAGENINPMLKKRDGTNEDMLFSQRTEESGNYSQAVISDYFGESVMIKGQTEGDWFVSGQPDKLVSKNESIDLKMFDGGYASSGDVYQAEKNKKDVLVDDSFMIQSRSLGDSQSDSLLRMDISMGLDIVEATQYESGTTEISEAKADASGAHEPDDLFMVLGRDSAAEADVTSWVPERDYEEDIFAAEANARHSGADTNAADDNLPSDGKGTEGKMSGNPGGKAQGKEGRSKVPNGSVGRSKSDISSRTKKPQSSGRTTVNRGKSNLEEENRRRMEELLIQRHKRIAERSSARGTATSNKTIPGKRISTGTSLKNEKPSTIQPPSQEAKKPVFRSSTIDRLATSRTTLKAEPAEAKPVQPKKTTLKANNLSQKTAGADTKKPSTKPVKTDAKENKVEMASAVVKLEEIAATQGTETTDNDLKEIKEFHSIGSIEKNERNNALVGDNVDFKECNTDSKRVDPYADVDQVEGGDRRLSIAVPVQCEERAPSYDHVESVAELTIHPTPESLKKTPNLSAVNIKENHEIHEELPTPKISEIEALTTPPEEINPEPTHTRKKWNSDENSPKAAKGFRKLLLFGKKSRTSATS